MVSKHRSATYLRFLKRMRFPKPIRRPSTRHGAPMLDTFRALELSIPHACTIRRAPPIERESIYYLATAVHIELFNLAQVIAARHAPSLQRELDDLRTRVVQEYVAHRTAIRSLASVIHPIRTTRPYIRWSDYQITPEISRSLDVTGTIVPRVIANKLVQKHREQVALITSLVYRERRKG